MTDADDEYENQPDETAMMRPDRGRPSRQESMVVNRAMVSQIVRQGAAELARLAAEERIDWSDLAGIKAATLEYLEQCEGLGIVPGMAGLSARLGRSRQAVYSYMSRNPSSDATKWLKSVSDSFGEMTITAAMSGAVSAIPAIFVSKSRYGWNDTPVIEAKETEEPEMSPDAIAAKYADLP